MNSEPDARAALDRAAAAQSGAAPFEGKPGDLGAAPVAQVDPLTAITRRIIAAQEALKEQSAQTKRKFDVARKKNSQPRDPDRAARTLDIKG